MDRRRKILLVLFEGLPETVIDSQVLAHARAVRERLGLDIEIWAFACTREIHAHALARRAAAEALAGCPVRVFRGLRPAAPGALVVNGLKVMRRLVKRPGEFALMHARTDYGAAAAGWAARALALPVLWDCRGDALAEFVESYGARGPVGRAAGAWKAAAIRLHRALAARVCRAALFVSAPLAALHEARLGGKPFAVAPCVADETAFFFDPALRETMRARLGYGPAQRVFVYSGSLAPYQCFDETVALFREIRAHDPNARLLALTPAVEAARAALAGLPEGSARALAAPFSEMNGYLNAADVAIMLRKPTGTNRVASPTKFAEYCLCGLPIIMTDAVIDSARLAGEIGNRATIENGRLVAGFPVDRAAVAARARARLTREAVIEDYARLYRAAGEWAASGSRDEKRRL